MARGVIEIFASIGVSIRNPSSVIATGFLDYDEPGMLSGHSDFKSLTLRYKWALCHGRAFVRSLPARAFHKRGRRGLPDRRSWPPTSDGFDLRGIVRDLTKGTITRRLSIRASHTSTRG